MMVPMMKKLASFLLLIGCALGSAHATGPYDGIYQETNSPVYWSVHQNGTSLIVTLYTNTSLTGQSLTFSTGQTYTPPIFDTWSLISGSINGANATISGMVNFRACTISMNLTFTPASGSTAGSAAISLTSVTPTAAATAQGFNCAALYPNLPISSSMTQLF